MADYALLRVLSVGSLEQIIQATVPALIGLGFLIVSVPAEYGLFVTTIAVTAAFQAIQAALVVTPMQILPNKQRSRRLREYQYGVFCAVSLAVTVAAVVVVPIIVTALTHSGFYVGFGSAVYALGTLLRLRNRAEDYSRHRPGSALVTSAVYGSCAVVACAAAFLMEPIAADILALVGLSAGFAVLVRRRGPSVQMAGSRPVQFAILRRLRSVWMWTVAGASASWLHLNFYLVAAYAIPSVGQAEIGLLGMARNALLPILLVTQGAGSVLRPRWARAVGIRTAQRETRQIITELQSVGLYAAGLYVVYVGAVAAAALLIVPLLAPIWSGLGVALFWWGVDALPVLAYGILVSVIMAHSRFRRIAVNAWVACLVGLLIGMAMPGQVMPMTIQISVDVLLLAITTMTLLSTNRRASWW